jgi:hypothetical protein
MPSFQLTVAVRARYVCWTQYVDAGLQSVLVGNPWKLSVRCRSDLRRVDLMEIDKIDRDDLEYYLSEPVGARVAS